MTVIAALADGHTVWMAADTAEHVNGTLAGRARKIRRVNLPHNAGTILLAITGAAGLATMATRAIEHPTPDTNLIPDNDLDAWADRLAIHITEAATRATPALTWTEQDGLVTPAGTLLLGYQGRLWHLLTHHALPIPDGMTALGSGIDFALGWLTASAKSGMHHEDRVRQAVAATCARIPHCAAPDGPLVEALTPALSRTPAHARKRSG